jgi:hypothetical protein
MKMRMPIMSMIGMELTTKSTNGLGNAIHDTNMITTTSPERRRDAMILFVIMLGIANCMAHRATDGYKRDTGNY